MVNFFLSQNNHRVICKQEFLQEICINKFCIHLICGQGSQLKKKSFFIEQYFIIKIKKSTLLNGLICRNEDYKLGRQ